MSKKKQLHCPLNHYHEQDACLSNHKSLILKEKKSIIEQYLLTRFIPNSAKNIKININYKIYLQ